MTLLEQFLTPSPRGEPAADFLAYGLAHCALGAAAMQLLGPWAWVFCLAYLVLKEGRDLIAGGNIADCIGDAAFVALGAVATPIAWIVSAIVATLVREGVR